MRCDVIMITDSQNRRGNEDSDQTMICIVH